MLSAVLLLAGCMRIWKPADEPPTHVVQPGETLYSIARSQHLDYRELARWNGIDDTYLIVPGQRLRLTSPGGKEAAPSAGRRAGPANPTEAVGPDLPWQWPIRGPLLRSFAATGAKGIDIRGVLGQPVQAAAPGRVVYGGSGLLSYGQLIIIKHNKDFLSAYAYNRRLYVKEGDEVVAGQAIAEMGLGTSGVPTLHFEIRIAGKPVDPLLYLPR